jgi:hypothetical protein
LLCFFVVFTLLTSFNFMLLISVLYTLTICLIKCCCECS